MHYAQFQLTHLLRGATHGRHSHGPAFYFNSRTSCEVRQRMQQTAQGVQNFNSRTSCEVRHKVLTGKSEPQKISTHAPLARCDVQLAQFVHIAQFISTHAPLARCDIAQVRHNCVSKISTHAPLARCDSARNLKCSRSAISTHAPLARCDQISVIHGRSFRISTHAPLARCDKPLYDYSAQGHISTHAPLARCDFMARCFWAGKTNFNSRTSCEVRLN